MFDFLRNLTKSAEEKRQEAITAYLDDMMSPNERERFAAQLAQEPTLQAEVERERAVKQSLSQLPQRRVPRNFTLDPARYGRPAKQPLLQVYPVLRAATGLAAFFFIFALFAGFYLNSFSSQGTDITASAPAAESAGETIAMDTAVEQEAEPAAEADSEAVEIPAEEPMEEAAEEEAMEEEAASDEEMLFEVTAEPVEEAMEEEPTFAATEAPSAAEGESMTGEEAPTGAEDAPSVPLPTQTMAAAGTPTAVPTATTSQLPRATATAELTDRAITTTTNTADTTDAGEIALAATAPSIDEFAAETAVPPQTEQPPSQPVNTLLLVQIGLLLLLIILGVITLYARRQL